MNIFGKPWHRSQITERISGVFKYLILALYLLVSIMLVEKYPGSLGSLLVFLGVVMAMLYKALSRTNSYSYIFLSFFLFMGFWTKLVSSHVFGIPLIEPAGEFDGSSTAWGSVLDMISIALIGLVLAKILFDRFITEKGLYEDIFSVARTVNTGLYKKYRTHIGLTTIAAIIIINLANYKYSFYVIGVNPEVELPFHLNVAIAWLAYFGIAMWLTVLVQWETNASNKKEYVILFLLLSEAFLAGAITLSRIIFLLHAFPLLVYIYFYFNGSWREKYGKKNLFLIVFVVAFISDVFLVQNLRADKYTQPDVMQENGRNLHSGGVYRGKDVMPSMNHQIAWLFLSRWVGIEGVQAVSSYPGRGGNALLAILEEDPNKGVMSIYQKISKSHYKQTEKYTFLTIPGVIAILGFSGHWLIILLGMFLLSLVLMLTEYTARKYIPGKPLAIFIGLNMAFTLSQMNFPYLTLIYMLQLWLALFVLYIVQKVFFHHEVVKRITGTK